MTQFQEIRVTGPPGTGKTTWIIRQVKRALKTVPAKKIVCTSFTKAAARVLSGKDIPIPPENIGTLHALAFRALRSPKIMETNKKLLAEWNDFSPTAQAVESSSRSLDESAATAAGIASLAYLDRYSLLRNRMIDRDRWARPIRAFAERWEAFKKEHDAVDFTDLIEIALNEIDTAPNEPSVFFVDEAQDLSKLELALARKWGKAAGYRFVLVGDPDQCIYEWTGADPRALYLGDLPPKNKIILGQSYRVPRLIHAQARKWIQQITDREDAPYKPREENGKFERVSYDFLQHPDAIAALAVEQAKTGNVMLLAFCDYQIAPVLEIFKRQGVPFGNRYRRRAGHWNPLRQSEDRSKTSMIERLLAFTKPVESWTVADALLFIEPLRQKGVMIRGTRKKLEGFIEDEVEDADGGGGGFRFDEVLVRHLFDQPDKVLAQDLDWLLAACKEKRRKHLAYLIRVFRKHGKEVISKEPPIIVGTIYSVKGGEADSVILNAGVSPAAAREARAQKSQMDSIRRVYYVGMTRARNRLTICGTCSNGIPSP